MKIFNLKYEKPVESKYSGSIFNLKEKLPFKEWVSQIIVFLVISIVANYFLSVHNVIESIGYGLWVIFCFMFIINPIHNWWIDRAERKTKEKEAIHN